MKKNYKMLAGLLALYSVASMDVSAQLNGLYTINSSVATGGTNFQSFTALATVINTAGISGPVTIDVVSGTGPYIEQVEFTAIAGTSSTNTITMNGNGNTLTFASANTNFPNTLLLSGTDYLTVNSLTVVGTGSSFAMALHLWNSSNFNSFNNCRFEVPITGTNAKQIPVSLNGTAISATTYGDCGNDNTWTNCVMTGGTKAFVVYGNTSAPATTNIRVINCNMLDFNTYGIQFNYVMNALARNNTIQRVNRTSPSSGYGIYMNGITNNARIEKNKIRRLFDGNPTSGNSAFGIYVLCSGTSASVNVISNNLISDITSSGTIYGLYEGGYGYNDFINNTVVLDNSVSTYGYCYGIMTYAPATTRFLNNLVSIDRTGTGDKICSYVSGSPTMNNNILYNGQSSGNNYVGYYNGTYATTFASWQQTSGFDLNGASGAPMFVNVATYNYTPANPLLNNVGMPSLGINDDINGLARNLPAPDAGAFEFFNQACTSVTGTNAIVTPTYVVCPTDMTNLSLANGYTVNGLTFQWQSASNAIGPFTAIAGATVASYVTPQLPANTFYNVLVTCVNGGVQYTTAVGQVSVAATTTNTPYYFDGFEGISVAGQLPNCSWYRTAPNKCKTQIAPVTGFRAARTGVKFAEFDSWNTGYTGTQLFWSNGLNLSAGVTYSAALWYNTPGYVTWTNLSLLYGTAQVSTGLVPIAVVAQPNSSTYQLLSNTFTVPTSGLYYIAIQARDNYSYSNLIWDDLEVSIPCHIPSNSAPVVVTGQSTVCAGTPIPLVASGAGSYTWSSGPNTNAITPSLVMNTSYTVTGTNTLSGCSASVVKDITVHQLPPIAVMAFDYDICPGQSVTLFGTGANSYTWSQGPTIGNSMIVSPLTTTTYTLIGLNAYGCMGTALQQIVVNPNPAITVNGNTVICEGYSTNLTAGGASNYTWTSNNAYFQSAGVTINPNTTTAYTITGTDANNCEGTAVVVVAVEVCTGIKNNSSTSSKVALYPNPNNGIFTVELNNGSIKNIEVLDVTGRVVYTTSSSNNTSEVNINELANGVYYIKVKSDNVNEVVKIVKH